MRATGIVRPVDKNGRVVIPNELRKQLDVKSDVDGFEIFTEDDMIILKKYAPYCIFCGSNEDVVKFSGKNICSKCIDEIKNTLGKTGNLQQG